MLLLIVSGRDLNPSLSGCPKQSHLSQNGTIWQTKGMTNPLISDFVCVCMCVCALKEPAHKTKAETVLVCNWEPGSQLCRAHRFTCFLCHPSSRRGYKPLLSPGPGCHGHSYSIWANTIPLTFDTRLLHAANLFSFHLPLPPSLLPVFSIQFILSTEQTGSVRLLFLCIFVRSSEGLISSFLVSSI